MITAAILKQICPHILEPEAWAPALEAAAVEFEINTPLREAAFLAQVCHESGCFAYVKELWGPTPQQVRYEPPGVKAAELGNTYAGDGFRYRGRGLIQLTGRANYRNCGADLELPLEDHPELLEGMAAASRSAGWFWLRHRLNELADGGDTQRITKRVNGGYNGLSERVAYYERALQIFSTDTA